MLGEVSLIFALMAILILIKYSLCWMTVVVRRIKNCFGYLIKGASGMNRVNGLESKKSTSVS